MIFFTLKFYNYFLQIILWLLFLIGITGVLVESFRILGAKTQFPCIKCGRCQDICPAANAGTFLSPKKVILELKNLYFKRDKEYDFIFWIGCLGTFEQRNQEVVKIILNTFNRLNLDYGVIKEEKCTGDCVRR